MNSLDSFSGRRGKSVVGWWMLVMSWLLSSSSIVAFVFPKTALRQWRTTPSQQRLSYILRAASSYEVGSDEDAEQRLSVPAPATEASSSSTAASTKNSGHYQNLLATVGLELKHTHDLVQELDHQPHTTVHSSSVFCNRELNFKGIRAIGFDMDYTLAEYQQPAFDRLAFDGAKQKLVHKLGYPQAVLNFEYDHSFWIRGLIIDTNRGNFLKIDRHKYVRVAYHGFDPISSTTRKILYSTSFNKVPSFTEKHFVNVDTLFQFVDAHLFASLIQLKDRGDYEFMDRITYPELYRHVRECVDLCHRDGSMKTLVAEHPEKYIVLDPGLIPMLQRFRAQGRKLFVLTNSLWEYTSTVMNYLYHQKKVSLEQQQQNEWLSLFDLVIVGSCKPAYMLDPYLNLFRVDPQTGSLRNTDGVFEIEALGPDGATKFLEQGKTFQGGNWLHLQAMLEIDAGEEILYVGDHLYSDVLRSKRTLGWRSAFVVPELTEEMRVFRQNQELAQQISELRHLREELCAYEEELRRTEDESDPSVQKRLQELQADGVRVKETMSDMARRWHGAFHPVWGAMFNAGYQDSRFAFYVQNYACLYTSRATNLGLSSIHRSFRTASEMLPHDRLLANPRSKLIESDPWEDYRN